MMTDFIRDGRIGEHYGSAAITRPARTAVPHTQ
jgi:hypothetical protein